MNRERAFRRLLRWYPASWRRAHGAVVLGTLLDAAEAEGRDAPTAAERRAAVVAGLAHRLTRRVAIVTAGVALALALVATGARLWPSGAFVVTAEAEGLLQLRTNLVALLAGLPPLFAIVSVAATARVRGMRSGAALLGVTIGAAAAIMLAVAMLSWSVGFDEADAGVPSSPLAGSFLVLLVAAWALGAATITILVAEPLRGRLRGGAYAVAFAAGATGWPLLAYALLSPTTTALVAVGALLAAVLATRPAAATAPATAPPATTLDAAPISPPARRGVSTALALVAAVGGAAAVVFALAGPMWTTLDGTQAMRAGIGWGLIAAVPLVCCLGVRRTGALHRWGPPALISLGLLVLAAENLLGAGGFFPMLLIATGLSAGGVAWLVATMPGLSGAVRPVAAVAAGVSVLVLGTLLQVLPFVLPLAALAVAAAGWTRPRPARPPASVAA